MISDDVLLFDCAFNDKYDNLVGYISENDSIVCVDAVRRASIPWNLSPGAFKIDELYCILAIACERFILKSATHISAYVNCRIPEVDPEERK